MSREELLGREDAAWSELEAAIAAVPPDRLEVEGVVPGWSVHDLVWHCAHWAGYGGDQLERLQGGEPDAEEGEDPPESEILTTGRGMDWSEVRLTLERNRERARAAFSAIGDPPEAAVAMFTEEAFGHYEEHAAEIRAFGA